MEVTALKMGSESREIVELWKVIYANNKRSMSNIYVDFCE